MLISVIVAISSSLVTALTNILVKLATRKMDPFLVNYFRVVIASIILILLNLPNFPIIISKITQEVILMLIYVALIGPVLAWYSYTKALSKGHVSILHPIANSYPLLAILLGYFIFRYTIELKHVVSSLLVLIGIILVTRYSGKVKIDYKPIFLASFATFLWSTNVIMFKFLTFKLTNWEIATFRAILATLIMSPIALLKLNTKVLHKIKYALLIGIIGDIFGFILWVTAIDLGPLPLVMPIIATAPIFSAIFSKFIFSESLTKVKMLGIIMACIGIGILSL